MIFWCNLCEDGDNAETLTREIIHRLQNCTFVGVAESQYNHHLLDSLVDDKAYGRLDIDIPTWHVPQSVH